MAYIQDCKTEREKEFAVTEYASLREKIAAEKKARVAKYAKFEEAFNEANKAGFAAGEFSKPTPMIVSEHASPMDDSSPVKKQWFVGEGACGFAWVNISPGNSPFANWLKKNKHASKAYHGGVDIWISAHGQSVERKEAHARKMAEVLKEKLGVNAYAGSRLD
jgi:hypothetical protein